MKCETKTKERKSASRLARIAAASGLVMLACSGCASYGPSVISDARLKDFSEDRAGKLRYKGEEVYQVELERPWYIQMLPNNGYQWGFTVGTFGLGVGAGAGLSGGSGGSSGNPSTSSQPVQTPSSSSGSSGGSHGSSGSSSSGSTSSSSGSSSSGSTSSSSGSSSSGSTSSSSGGYTPGGGETD